MSSFMSSFPTRPYDGRKWRRRPERKGKVADYFPVVDAETKMPVPRGSPNAVYLCVKHKVCKHVGQHVYNLRNMKKHLRNWHSEICEEIALPAISDP